MSDNKCKTVIFGAHGNGCTPSNLLGCHSATFTVDDKPVVVRAFGLQESDKLVLEAVCVGDGDLMTSPVAGPCGCPVSLTMDNPSRVVAVSGTYRLNRCYCLDAGEEPEYTTEATVVVEDINTNIQYQIGDTNMSKCDSGSQVTMTKDPNGCTTIVVDGTACTICPGSVVSVIQPGDGSTILTVDGQAYLIPAAPTVQCVSGGVEINGVLCPTGSVVTAVDNGDCTGTITVDGVPITFLTEEKDPNGHDPATVSSTDGVLTVASSGQSFDLTFHEENASAQIAGNPNALAVLCAGIFNDPSCVAAMNNAVDVVVVSGDAGNVLTSGSDGGAMLTASAIAAAVPAQDPAVVTAGDDMNVTGTGTPADPYIISYDPDCAPGGFDSGVIAAANAANIPAGSTVPVGTITTPLPPVTISNPSSTCDMHINLEGDVAFSQSSAGVQVASQQVAGFLDVGNGAQVVSSTQSQVGGPTPSLTSYPLHRGSVDAVIPPNGSLTVTPIVTLTTFNAPFTLSNSYATQYGLFTRMTSILLPA